ncbi:MAG: DNA starvation/stationary phase protection protein Dps [Leptolyngbyaceae cyanobacterium HOT.MB2.61]|jgi:starvation-inducible DNA-binding protein|nr:DNA starvation/stationary phase protection protein Dps [Leptolyngbyaceae cyanobacterium HOT.MB2.61]
MSDNSGKLILHPTRIDIPEDKRSQIIELLNQTLAATLDLKTQVKQAHWNVKGLDFYQLHELFDEMAGELEEYIDLMAERVTALGGAAMGTARIAAAKSILPKYPFTILDGKDHIVALADRYAPYARHLREAIDQTDDLGDADTADLYTEVSRTIDMRLWFLEAHLQADQALTTSNGASSKTVASKTSTRSTTAKRTTKAAAAKTPTTKAIAAKTPGSKPSNKSTTQKTKAKGK